MTPFYSTNCSFSASAAAFATTSAKAVKIRDLRSGHCGAELSGDVG
jgi:hypothetical protein